MLDRLPAPDRVFVGGGGLDVLDACFAALRPGGRLVATFAAVDRAAAAYRRLGHLVQVGVDRAEALPDGGVRFAADNPVFVAWGDAPSRGRRRTAGRRVAVGIGCSSGATADEVAAVVADGPAPRPARRPQPSADRRVATIDVRAGHPALPPATITFPSALLGLVDVPNPSAAVDAAVGTPSVAEAAALLAAGPGGRLVVPKRKGATATAAVAVGGPARRPRLGPRRRTRARAAPPTARPPPPPPSARPTRSSATGPTSTPSRALLRPDQLVLRGTMGAEADRARAALSLAAVRVAGGARVLRRRRACSPWPPAPSTWPAAPTSTSSWSPA